MSDCAEIAELFKQHDANQDGTIDEAELTAVMSGIGFSEEDCKKMFAEADMNQDGVIKYEEFLAWVFSGDAEGEAPAEESDAPFMKEAFRLMSKGILEMADAAMEGGDPEAAMAKEEAMQAQFVELLGKSFDHHDKSATGTLDTEEAKVFFHNLVSESGAFMEAIVTVSAKKMIDMTLRCMLEAMKSEEATPPEEGKQEAGQKMAMIQAMREGLKSGVQENKERCMQQIEDYKANKEERNAAAFAILDPDGAGSISKEVFIKAFTPGNEKSDQVMQALGIDMPEEGPGGDN
jgi:Ca2+-binding EF-hand superfamily protein